MVLEEYRTQFAGLDFVQMWTCDWHPINSNFDGYITLFRVLDQSNLYNMHFGAGVNGQWNYQSLPSVIKLNAGEEYIIGSIWTTGGYYFGTAGAAEFRPTTGPWTYIIMAYCNSCTPTTYPTSSLSGYTYGVATFAYLLSDPNASLGNE